MKDFINEIGQDVLAFTNMFNFIKDLVFLMEADNDSFRYIYVNQSAIKVLNIDGNIIGGWIEDFVPAELARIMIPKYREAQLTKKPVNFIEILESDNEEFIGEASLNPILSENGQCKYILAIVRDVTDRKREERELKETKNNLEKHQKRLNSLVENNGDAIYEMDLKGNLISINNMFTIISGYGESEIVGTSFVPLIVEEYLDGTLAHFMNSIEGSREEYETWIRNKEGQLVQLLVKNVPIIIDGDIVGIYGIAKDVTALNTIDKELQESQEKYRLITENAFDIIQLMNTSGIVEYVSPSNENILGYNYEEYVGHPITKYIHPDDITNIEKGFKRIISGAKPLPYELRVLHKNGHYLWMEASTTQIVENGGVKQLVTIARDITERKKHREDLAKMAFYDYLTGLPNRRTFDERFNMAILQANRSNKKVAVMMLDGRRFKSINDTFGHDAGDAVLKEMAKRLKTSVRQTDTVARLGGDEMGIILPEIETIATAEDIVQRIIASFKEPLYFKDHEIVFGAGIGIAFYPDHSGDKKQLIKYADDALYEAKKSEQNDYRIYNNGISQ